MADSVPFARVESSNSGDADAAPLSRSSDSLNVRIMPTISNMDAEERHKAFQAFEDLREAKVNLLERVRYGAPAADIESAIEEFEEAWSVTERLVNPLIAPSKS
jgi:hypothetical protein